MADKQRFYTPEEMDKLNQQQIDERHLELIESMREQMLPVHRQKDGSYAFYLTGEASDEVLSKAADVLQSTFRWRVTWTVERQSILDRNKYHFKLQPIHAPKCEPAAEQ